jgi:FlaA1/EpsC-like NDP-sugar epimerase
MKYKELKLPRWLKHLLYIAADMTIISFIHLVVLIDLPIVFEMPISLYAFLALVVIKLALFHFFGIYQMITSHFGIIDALKIGLISLFTNLLYALFWITNGLEPLLIVVVFLLTVEPFFLIGIRLARRLLYIVVNYSKADRRQELKTLIIGAGAAGKLIIDELRTNKSLKSKPILVIDDDLEKRDRRFLNLKVDGPISDVSKFIKQYEIDQVVIAIGNISRSRLFEILRYMQHDAVKIRRLPLMEELENSNQKMKIKDVDIHELLGRDVIPLINDDIKAFIKNQTVLVTGAGGSIGSELVRQIFSYQPKHLILLDIYENSVYDVQQELVRLNAKLSNPIKMDTVIGSTYDETRMEQIFNKYKPNLVFHAAAYKHVPLMEDSPQEAVKTNILGTYHIAKLSMNYGVKKMVLVSTDKAVRPTNVMGATKYYAEAIIRHFSQLAQKTSYSAVRFGNVLGSNGSVIPLFQKQIEAGGPVTVTDKNITRYFMTIPEAVGLILQSSVYAKGGEIFVLDMGQPVRIIDLAEKMIRQSGFVPYEEIDIVITGLRPGEKMYEELLIDPNMNIRTKNEKIFIDRDSKWAFSIDQYSTIIHMAFTNDENIVNELFTQINQEKLKKE